MISIIDGETLSNPAVLVHEMLCRHAAKSSMNRPSIATIAKKARLSELVVAAAMEELADIGHYGGWL